MITSKLSYIPNNRSEQKYTYYLSRTLGKWLYIDYFCFHFLLIMEAKYNQDRDQLLFFFIFFFFFLKKDSLRVWVLCLCVSVCTRCVPGPFRGQKKALDLLELESQAVVNNLENAETWTWVWSHLSSHAPFINILNYNSVSVCLCSGL